MNLSTSKKKLLNNYQAIACSVRSACGMVRKVTKLLCGSEDAKSILKICYAAYQAQLETVFKNTEVKSS